MRAVVLRNLSANWVGHVVISVLAFVTLPIVLSRLGAEAYGLWIAVVSIVTYTEVLQAGLGESLVRALAVRIGRQEWQACNAFFSFALYAFACVSLLVAVAVVILWLVVIQFIPVSPRLADLMLPIAVLVTANTMVTLVFAPFSAVLWARERFDLVNVVTIAGRLAFLLAVIPLLHGERDIVSLAAIRLALSAASHVATALLARRVMPTLQFVAWREARAAYREMARFTPWVFIRVVAGRVVAQSDVVVLAFIRGPAAVAVYSVARSLVDYTQGLLEKLEVIGPTASVLHGRGDRGRVLRLFASSSKGATMLALTASAYLLVFGGDLIRTWVGPAFVDAALLLDILLIALIVKAPHLPSRSVLLATGEVRRPAALALAEALLNLGLCALLGLRFGAVGIACAVAIPAVLFGGIGFLPVVARKLSVSAWDLVRTVYLAPCRGAVIPLALCVAASALWQPAGYVSLFSLVPAIALLFGVSFYVFSLEPAERDAVRQVVGSLRNFAVLRLRNKPDAPA